MYGEWITVAKFRDGNLYQGRWFRDERGCGIEYRMVKESASVA